MNPFFVARELLGRAFDRKKLILSLCVAFLICMILGMIFACPSEEYSYQVHVAERYLDRVCFSERSIFLIWLERFAGHALILALILLGGVCFAASIVPAAILMYRAYMFGSCIVIFFSVYRLTGVIVVFAVYLPVHLLFDALFLCAAAVSWGRGRCFHVCKRDFAGIFRDFLVFLAIVALICLAEALLLLAIFRPLGNIV